MSVRVEVMNRTLIPICLDGMSWGLQWPDTAPGSEALLECPRYFVGRRVSRLCSMKDATTPEWQIPDFSSCLYKALVSPYNNVSTLSPSAFYTRFLMTHDDCRIQRIEAALTDSTKYLFNKLLYVKRQTSQQMGNLK